MDTEKALMITMGAQLIAQYILQSQRTIPAKANSFQHYRVFTLPHSLQHTSYKAVVTVY